MGLQPLLASVLSQLARLFALLWLLAASASAQAVSRISIEAGSIDSAAGQARDVRLDYRLDGKLELRGEIKPADAGSWSQARLSCAGLAIPTAASPKASAGDGPNAWRCEGGRVDSERIKGAFALAVDLRAPERYAVRLQLDGVSFSDAAGLRAGEKVSGDAELHLQKLAAGWQWKTAIDWREGEVFWQPFYFAAGGHALTASGMLDAQALVVEKASLSLKGVGQAQFRGRVRKSDQRIQTLQLDAPALNLASFYPLLLKPILAKTAFNDLEMAGQAGLMLSMQNGEFDAVRLDLRNADLEDKSGRFALYKIDASLPWAYDEAKNLSLTYAGGRLLKLPLGPTQLNATVNRYALTADTLRLPILDGALALSDVSAAWVNKQWHWHLRANVVPISMTEFSQALGWPTMQGQLSAQIPLVTYSAGQLTTDGALRFNIFNGTATIDHLAMQDPLGRIPQLSGDMQFRRLDLGALTRTFSFGAIEGKLDGDVNGLQLVNWQPVRFDAVIYSSPGDYRKKISQRAVENISALGGAGAAAAIQRSFLRFFDDFNYSMIGLSCRLQKERCLMGGIESVKDGAAAREKAVNNSSSPFVIVKGSGVPAITVLGYNRSVSWTELLGRLKRITEGNSKPIIK